MPETAAPQRPEFLDRAEADKFAAQKAEHEANAEKARAEARKLAAEAEKAEHETVEAKIKREKADREWLKEVHKNEFHHRYVFSGSVDGASCQKLIDQLDFWDRTEPEGGDIEIVFFSPGGGVFAGVALFDHIAAFKDRQPKKWHVTTVIRGYAASMGGVLVQAGDKRVMGPESYLHLHEVSAGAIGKQSEIEDEVTLMKKMTERIISIYASRSKMTAGRIRGKMMRKEWWLSSDEALKIGFVDEIA